MQRNVPKSEKESKFYDVTLFYLISRLVTKEIHSKGFEITDVKISRLISLNNIIAKVFQYEKPRGNFSKAMKSLSPPPTSLITLIFFFFPTKVVVVSPPQPTPSPPL